jgi:hypothetical protein
VIQQGLAGSQQNKTSWEKAEIFSRDIQVSHSYAEKFVRVVIMITQDLKTLGLTLFADLTGNRRAVEQRGAEITILKIFERNLLDALPHTKINFGTICVQELHTNLVNLSKITLNQLGYFYQTYQQVLHWEEEFRKNSFLIGVLDNHTNVLAFTKF